MTPLLCSVTRWALVPLLLNYLSFHQRVPQLPPAAPGHNQGWEDAHQKGAESPELTASQESLIPWESCGDVELC